MECMALVFRLAPCRLPRTPNLLCLPPLPTTINRPDLPTSSSAPSPAATLQRGKQDNSPSRLQHLVVRMPEYDPLYSARGVRFKEIKSNNDGNYEKGWPNCHSPSTVISGPLVRFSFLLSEKVEKISYRQHQQQLKKEFERLQLYDEGLLFNTREKGVLYPVFHLSHKNDITINQDKLPPGLYLHQGLYEEVRNIVPEIELPQVTSNVFEQSNIGYIMLGFKSLDRNFSQVMVDTWKDWTGARYIYMYLPDDLGLRRITFYRRQQPDELEFFMYLVLVECHGITNEEKQLRFLDFAHRMRLERMSGYISVYSAEKKSASYSAENTKISSQPVSKHVLDVILNDTVLPRNTRV